MRPLESCELCFRDGKSDFVEIYKNRFQSIRRIHPLKFQLTEKILSQYDIVMERGYMGSFTFVTPKEKKQEIIDRLKDVGIPIHSLTDHIAKYSKIYQSSRKKTLGDLSFVKLPPNGSWEWMNPTTRRWEYLTVFKSVVSGANVRINSIIKQEYRGTNFFKVIGSKENCSAVPISKIAAYNMMTDQFNDSTAFWIEKPGNISVISRSYLSNIPADFFNTMVRLRPTETHLKGFLLFDSDDFPLVERLLSMIRIKLVLQSDIKIIQTRTTPTDATVFYLDSLEKERIDTVTNILQKLGGIVEKSENTISVTGRKKPMKLFFYDSAKNSISANSILISNNVLTDPERLEDTIKVIKNTCGLNNEFLDFLIAVNWPIITSKDLDFLIQAAVDFYPLNKEKAKQIVSKNHTAIKNWYKDVVDDKIKVQPETSFIIGKLLR